MAYGGSNDVDLMNTPDMYNWHTAWPELGGDDKIYGGNGVADVQVLVGGPYNDKIFSGHDNLDDIAIYGDKDDDENYGSEALIALDALGDGDPLTEFPDTFNKYDGDDIIDVGDNNFTVKVYGQGGNDKITGGYGAN